MSSTPTSSPAPTGGRSAIASACRFITRTPASAATLARLVSRVSSAAPRSRQIRTSLASTSGTAGHLVVEHLDVDAGSRRRVSSTSSPRRPLARRWSSPASARPCSSPSTGCGHEHQAVQEAGADDVEDAAVDGDRGVEHPRQRRRPGTGRRPARPGPRTCRAPRPACRCPAGSRAGPRLTDDEGEDREGQERPVDRNTGQVTPAPTRTPMTAPTHAGHDLLGGGVAQAGLGGLDRGDGAAAEDAAEHVAQGRAEHDARARGR